MLINISDHATRIKATSGSPASEVRVLGCLLGQQVGRVVDISNSFELRHELAGDGSVLLDEAFLTKKLGQCMPALSAGYCLGTCTSKVDCAPAHTLVLRRQTDLCAPGCGGLVCNRLSGAEYRYPCAPTGALNMYCGAFPGLPVAASQCA